MFTYIKRILKWIKEDLILSIAILLAIFFISLAFLTADLPVSMIQQTLWQSIDQNTLSLLFSLMLVVEGLRKENVFSYFASKILQHVRTQRSLYLTLLFLPFFLAMFITNDVALITCVPLSLVVLSMLERREWMAEIVALQCVGANLGSMMMPMGNPQNLYLYEKSGLTLSTFIGLLLPYVLLAATIIFFFCLRKQKTEIPKTRMEEYKFSTLRITLYTVSFLLCVIGVLKWISPIWLAAGLVCIFLCVDKNTRNVLISIDYRLLFTFLAFFLFIGSLSMLPAIKNKITQLLLGREVLLSIILSQVMSNVPAALLLSNFTNRQTALLIGCNLGGLGTLIASLANLIGYRLLMQQEPSLRRAFLKQFTMYNLLFLIILGILAWLQGWL